MTLLVGLEIPADDLVTLLQAEVGGVPDQLDASGAAYVVLGAERARTSGSPSPSPVVVGTVLARRTRHVGIVVATSAQRDHPYNAARRVASLDHVSGGRAGHLALPRDAAIDLGVGDGSAWIPGRLATAQRVDSLRATRKLWRSWPVETLDADPDVAAAAVVRHADHVGAFSTKGPLNVPTTPQGEPVVLWSAGAGADLVDELVSAATVADVLVVDHDRVPGLDHEPGLALARVHVRVPFDEPDLETVLAGLADAPPVHGVVLVAPLAALPDVAALLSRLAADAVVSLRPAGARRTLRDLLGVPRRREPDLSDHEPAFAALSRSSL